MPGIGVINNPRSRQNKRHPERIRKLGYMLGEGGTSKATWSFEDLESCAREFKERDIDILAINGGDGSNHVTLTKFIEVYGDKPLPKIALLRGGTLNTISDSFGIKGEPRYLLYNVVDKYSNHEPFTEMQADLMKINGMYGFLFGNGIVANFMDSYYETGTPSVWQGVKTLVKGASSAAVGGPLAKAWFEPIRARMTIDGQAVEVDRFTSMLAGTVKEIGVGFAPWPRAFEVPHTFAFSFFTTGPLGFLPELPYFYLHRPIHPKTGGETLARSVHIEAEKAFSYTLDGDMYTCEDGRMDITIGPRITIIVR